MDVADIILSGGVVLGLCGVSYVLGKRAKLKELHDLQEEGYLTITYDRKLTGGTSSEDVGPTMHELLHAHEQQHEQDQSVMGEVRYIRRDQDGPRRDDWARSLKARSLQHQTPDPEPDEPDPQPAPADER